MKQRGGFYLLFAIVVAAGHVQALPPRPLKPLTLSVDALSKPFWISAEAATTPAGEVNYEAFDAGLRSVIQSQAIHQNAREASASNTEEAPCTGFTMAGVGAPSKAMSTWRDATQNAAAMIAGTVTDVTPGFYVTSPATLVTVKIEKVLRRAAPYPREGYVVIPYFGADFRIGQTRFCNAGLPRNGMAFLPAVNDQVLILAFEPPRGTYLPVIDANLIFGRNGAVYVPLAFERFGPVPAESSFGDLLSSIDEERPADRSKRRGERP